MITTGIVTFILIVASMAVASVLLLTLRNVNKWMGSWEWRWIFTGYFLLWLELLVGVYLAYQALYDGSVLGVVFSVIMFLKVMCYTVGFMRWHDALSTVDQITGGILSRRAKLERAELKAHQTILEQNQAVIEGKMDQLIEASESQSDAAAVVADNLAAQQDRASKVDTGEAGAAADAASVPLEKVEK